MKLTSKGSPPSKPPAYLIPLPQKSLRQEVVSSLLTAIFTGQLRAGEYLNANKLAEHLGVSATPVREALLELATIGIVETRHNYGTRVRPFGPVQLRDIYHLRRVLETEATRCAAGKTPALDLQRLHSQMTRLMQDRTSPHWSETAMASDRELHELIIAHSQSQRLAEEIGRYNSLIHCIRQVVGNESQAQQRALPEHLQIIDALLKEDADLAAQGMARHILSTAQAVEIALFQSSGVLAALPA